MLLFKLLAKTALALALIGFGAGITAVSGCGNYVPHEPPVIADPGEQEEPGEQPDEPGEQPEEPTDKTYVNTRLIAGDYSTTAEVGQIVFLDYSGELNNVHIQFDFSTEYKPQESITDRASLSIGSGNSAIFKAGKSYELTITNNSGYFWYDNFGLQAIESVPYIGWNLVETYQFKPGTVTFTPKRDIWLLEVQLLPYPVTAAGTVDFYLTLTTT